MCILVGKLKTCFRSIIVPVANSHELPLILGEKCFGENKMHTTQNTFQVIVKMKPAGEAIEENGLKL